MVGGTEEIVRISWLSGSLCVLVAVSAWSERYSVTLGLYVGLSHTSTLGVLPVISFTVTVYS